MEGMVGMQAEAIEDILLDAVDKERTAFLLQLHRFVKRVTFTPGITR